MTLRELDMEITDTWPRRDVDLSVLWTIAAFNFRMFDVRMMRAIGDRLAALGQTPAAVTALLVLESNPGISQGQLADALLVRRPNMTKLVNRLETDGLVARRAAPDDRRRIAIAPTSAGRQLAARALGVLRDHDALVLSVLAPAEQAMFLDFVRRMRGGLESGSLLSRSRKR